MYSKPVNHASGQTTLGIEDIQLDHGMISVVFISIEKEEE